jgi:hypothetical protein
MAKQATPKIPKPSVSEEIAGIAKGYLGNKVLTNTDSGPAVVIPRADYDRGMNLLEKLTFGYQEPEEEE